MNNFECYPDFQSYYNEYKEQIILHQNWVNEYKIRVEKLIQERNLYCIMNDTKWLKLLYYIDELEFPPAYFQKYITMKNIPSYSQNLENYIPTSYGDWSNFYVEGLTVLFDIEWLKVIPKYGRHLGRLIPGEICNEEKQFKLLLERLFIPYEYSEGIFTIFGYKSLKKGEV